VNWFLFALVWVLNFGISIWNAYACGRVWVETKHYGGWRRFMTWMGAIMSASGFTWCYLILLALLAQNFEWISQRQLEVALNLGYIAVIPGILFSGLMITLDSWAAAYRNRNLASFGIAAYNTYAQIHNTYSAISGLGQAFHTVGSFFNDSESSESDRNRDKGKLVVILLVVAALLLGVLTTALIIWRVAGSQPLPSWDQIEQNRRAEAAMGQR